MRTQLVLLVVRPEQAISDAPSDSVVYTTVTFSMAGEYTLSSEDPYYSNYNNVKSSSIDDMYMYSLPSMLHLFRNIQAWH